MGRREDNCHRWFFTLAVSAAIISVCLAYFLRLRCFASSKRPPATTRFRGCGVLSASLALELRNERAAGWPGRRVLSKDDHHRHGHVARSAFDTDLDQRSAVEVRLHDVQGHVPPSQPGLEERMLGSEIREA